MDKKILSIISSRNDADDSVSITVVFEYKGFTVTEFFRYPELMPPELYEFVKICGLYGFKKILSTDYIDVWEKEVKE